MIVPESRMRLRMTLPVLSMMTALPVSLRLQLMWRSSLAWQLLDPWYAMFR